MVGLTRAFVAARDELSALSFSPSRDVSVLGRCGLPLCSFVLRSLPHGAASIRAFGAHGQKSDIGPLHSMTSSAVASSVGGIISPSAFAVLRFTAVSYLVGACTGRSIGLTPRRMRST